MSSHASTFSTLSRSGGLLHGSAFVLVAFMVASNAWICDDAYITMRTAENFLRGDGLTWNPGERVQAYTHPLWLFGLITARALTRDAYFAMLLLSFVTTLLALCMLSWIGSHSRRAAWWVLALGFSPAFVQYSTGGLENPATHVLILIFAGLYFRGAPLAALVATGSLVALNRADAIVLVAPALAFEAIRSHREHGARATIRALVLGGLPLALWESFSLVYYGSFVPNTAHAKLAHGLPRTALARQGLHYLASFATFDPIGSLIATFGLGLGIASVRTSPRRAAIAFGGLAYVCYLVWIGGDFMAGRMLTPLIVTGALLLMSSRLEAFDGSGPAPYVMRALLLLLAFLPQRHVLAVFSESTRIHLPEGPLRLYSTHWVADEQRNYHEATGLLRWFDTPTPPPWHSWYSMGLRFRAEGGVHAFRNIGFAGWAAEDRAHLIDPYGLSEPMLARLPAFRNPDWHVGHYQRSIPTGYARSIETGTCAMDNVELCELFHDLQLITKGPLFSMDRALAMHRVGMYRPSGEVTFEMRHPGLIEADAHPSRAITFGDSGIRIALPESDAGEVRVALGACVEYEIRFVRADEVIHRTRERAHASDGSCLLVAHSNEPFDMIWVLPQGRPGPYDFHGATRRD